MAEFTFYNATTNELTLSADGFTYGYIGRATLTNVAQATTGTITKTAGRSTYTIDWAADIIVALPLKSNGTTALLNMIRSGNTWTITVHKGNGATNADNFDIQEATEVYVFGMPVPGTLSTVNLFDVNGVVCADLSRQPLTYKAIISMGAGVLDVPMPGGASVPAIVGAPFDRFVTSVAQSSLFINREHGRGWQLNAGTGRIERNVFLDRWTQEDGGASPVNDIYAINAILIEAAGL